MDDFQYLFAVLLFAILVAGAVAAVLFRRLLIRKGLIQRSLNLVLLAVRLVPAQPTGESSLQQIREKIALMEQFYANLSIIRDSFWQTVWYGKPTFALELALPHMGEELSFFIAMPRRLSGSVEKLIQGFFPDAQIEIVHDYNIFNPEGAALGSAVTLKESQYLPVRTFQKLEADPLRAMTNVFTKLAREGEGAVLQIVARPAVGAWKGILQKHARALHEGKPPPSHDPVMSVVRSASEFFGAEEKKDDKPKELRRLTPLEEDEVRTIETKAGKALFEVNVRLLSSASGISQADAILKGLESAFNQFTDPNSNSFRADRLEGRGFKRLTFNFSFRAFDESKKIILSTEELTSLFHFPNVPLETPKLKMAKAREAASPANLPQDGILLGYNEFRGIKAEIRMTEEDRRRHLYTIGQTGTGKSVFLKNMIVQDIEAGKGVCVIDPHGELLEDVLGFVPRHRAQDVIYFNPGDVERPMGLNMLEYDPNYPEQKTFIVNELFSIFQKLYGAVPESMGPMFEQYFRNATMLVMEDPASGNTMLEIERVMIDKAYRELKLSRSANIVVNNFWKLIAEKAGGEASLQNMVPYITSKFDVFLANEIMRPVIAQEKSAFHFREVMDSQKILLVNLSKGRLGDINSSLIGLIVVGKILMAALSRTDMEESKRNDFYLYIDEFQNVTTDSIATILSEARKYRLDLIITHQFIGQLKEEIKKAVFGNVGSMVSFRIGSDDAEFMAKQYKPVFAEQDLLQIDNFNCYVKLLIHGATQPPFSMKTYPPKKGDPEAAAVVKEMSRAKYGRPREEVEQEIIAKHST